MYVLNCTRAAQNLSKSVKELARMDINAFEDSYIATVDAATSAGDPGQLSAESKVYWQRLFNLFDAVGEFRFGDEWLRRKYADAKHIATVVVAAE